MCGKLTKPYHLPKTVQLISQQSLSSIINKQLQIQQNSLLQPPFFPPAMHICWLLTSWLCVFCVQLTKPSAFPKLFNWSASKAWRVLSTTTVSFNKTAYCINHYVLFGCILKCYSWYSFVVRLPNPFDALQELSTKSTTFLKKRPPVATTVTSGYVYFVLFFGKLTKSFCHLANIINQNKNTISTKRPSVATSVSSCYVYLVISYSFWCLL